MDATGCVDPYELRLSSLCGVVSSLDPKSARSPARARLLIAKAALSPPLQHNPARSIASVKWGGPNASVSRQSDASDAGRCLFSLVWQKLKAENEALKADLEPKGAAVATATKAEPTVKTTSNVYDIDWDNFKYPAVRPFSSSLQSQPSAYSYRLRSHPRAPRACC